MNQPGYNPTMNSQYVPVAQADPNTSHKIDMLCMAILVLLL